MRVMGPRDKDGDVGKKACKVPFSCRVVSGLAAIHAIHPCNGFGLTDAGHYIIRSISMSLRDCVIVSDPMELCLTWHV